MFTKLYKDHFLRLKEIYQRALNNHNIDQLIIFSGEVKKKFRDDLPYAYYVNAQFKACVPLTDAPNSWVIWTQGNTPVLLFYQPEDYWHLVPELKESYWTAYFDIKVIKTLEEVKQYFIDSPNKAFLGELNDSIKDWGLGDVNPEPLIAELNWYRSYKTDYEMACIREANCISAKGHYAAKKAFFGGASEFEISLAFQSGCNLSEEELAYPSIIGINTNASILHYFGRSKRKFERKHRRSLLIDAGADFYGYASDVTRTYSYKKQGMFADMIDALDEQQRLMVKDVTLGERYFDLNIKAFMRVSKILKDLGIIRMDSESAVETGVINNFLPHGLGHFIGVQVHDVGGNQADASGKIIEYDEKYPKVRMMRHVEAGHVITVEPGIYFIEPLLTELKDGNYKNEISWDVVEKLVPYGGIRIEDNVIIKASKIENVTRQAFETLDE